MNAGGAQPVTQCLRVHTSPPRFERLFPHKLLAGFTSRIGAGPLPRQLNRLDIGEQPKQDQLIAGFALVWLLLDGKTAVCHPSHQKLIVKNASAVCEQAIQRKKQFKEIGISLETKVRKQFYCHLERQTLEVAEVVARSSYPR